MVPFESWCAVFYSHSIVTMALSCIISEIEIFSTSLHSTPPLWLSSLEYCYTVWYRKTRIVWLPDGDKSLMIILAVSIEDRLVTDTQTDRRTDGQTSFNCDGIVRAVHSVAR